MSHDRDELERLRRENRELNEQIKLLVQTEQRLYRSQNVLDRQLAQVRTLSEFALEASGCHDAEGIVGLALVHLRAVFAVDRTLALRREPGDAGDYVVLEQRVGGRVRAAPALDAALNLLQSPLVVDGQNDGGLSLEALESWLDPALEGGGERPPSRRWILLPLRLNSGDLYGLILLGAGLRRHSFHAEQPSGHHLAFLRLVSVHIGRELDRARLTHTLRERGVELVEANERLRASLEELERTQQQLVQAGKMQAIGRLAGGVAHDFNNLLTVVLNYAELLKTSPALGEEERQELEEILRAAARGCNLTRQLLTFSRKQDLRPEALPLNELVGEMARMLRRLIGETIVLRLSLDPSVERIHADRGRMEQILLNLAVNARDAMPKGGQLIIETRKINLDPALRSRHTGLVDGPFVALVVSDTGHGMSADTLEHLFEPFFTTKAAGGGTGLGLATVYGIVQQSGGAIDVHSEPGRGTTFIVYLPSIQGATATSEGTPAPAEESCGGGTILLAEDEEGIRRVARDILKAKGYTVLDAGNGEEALHRAMAHEGGIDLLLTDVVMPGLGGVELAQRLAQVRPGLRVVFMSGYPASPSDGNPAGFPAEYLHKPFRPAELLAYVERGFRRRQSGD